MLKPGIDSVVTKIPRIAFEKFPQGACARLPFTLTTQMKSVGEAMAIGRTFKESLQKCLRSLEIGRSSVRSEIFVVATHAIQFPSPVGAAYFAPDGAGNFV